VPACARLLRQRVLPLCLQLAPLLLVHVGHTHNQVLHSCALLLNRSSLSSSIQPRVKQHTRHGCCGSACQWLHALLQSGVDGCGAAAATTKDGGVGTAAAAQFAWWTHPEMWLALLPQLTWPWLLWLRLC
jgi:hypothetical protein